MFIVTRPALGGLESCYGLSYNGSCSFSTWQGLTCAEHVSILLHWNTFIFPGFWHVDGRTGRWYDIVFILSHCSWQSLLSALEPQGEGTLLWLIPHLVLNLSLRPPSPGLTVTRHARQRLDPGFGLGQVRFGVWGLYRHGFSKWVAAPTRLSCPGFSCGWRARRRMWRQDR